MKYLILFFLILTITSCTRTVPVNGPDWLLGTWERTNDSGEQKTFETWTKRAPDQYLGLGYTMHNSDTVFKENLHLIKTNNTWTYEVTGVNPTPTIFTFTQNTKNSFTCENKTNDFPKKIHYFIQNDTLSAIISDDHREVPFYFIKI